MKWFQVDSDTPNDPKIRAVIRELGVAGMGALFFLWCHIADHGIRKPGWSINTFGHPIPESELIEVSKLSDSDFAKLALICTSNGHWLKKPWEARRVIAIPAMSRRADTYTKRQMRSGVDESSKQVRSNFANSTVQDSTYKEPPNPLSAKGGRLTRTELKEAKEIRARSWGGCKHDPRCANYDACVRAIALSRKTATA
jgi:hypothetical protein